MAMVGIFYLGVALGVVAMCVMQIIRSDYLLSQNDLDALQKASAALAAYKQYSTDEEFRKVIAKIAGNMK